MGTGDGEDIRDEEKTPFSTVQFAYEIDGIHTEFILSTYTNLLFFTITQYSKLGTIIKAKRENIVDGQPSFTVRTLIGNKDPSMEIYALRLIEVTNEVTSKPLLLAISLKKSNPQIFKQIVQIVQDSIK